MFGVLVLTGLATGQDNYRCDWESMLKCAVDSAAKFGLRLGEAAQVLSSMDHQQMDYFCEDFHSVFETCLNPYRGGCPKALEVALDGIQKAGIFACRTYKDQVGLQECLSQPTLEGNLFACNMEAGVSAYTLIYGSDMSTPDYYYNHICNIGNDLFRCVDDTMYKADCKPCAARWIRELNYMMVYPASEAIDCKIVEEPEWMTGDDLRPTKAPEEPTTTPWEASVSNCWGTFRHRPLFVSLGLLVLVAMAIIVVVCCCRRRRSALRKARQQQGCAGEAEQLPEKPSLDELQGPDACTNPVYAIARPMTPPTYNEAAAPPPEYTTMSEEMK